MIPAIVPVDITIEEIDLTISETRQANSHLFIQGNFKLDIADLEKNTLVIQCVTMDADKDRCSATCNIFDEHDNNWLGLLSHLEYQNCLDDRINALMYWIYQPLQENLITLPRCYTVSDHIEQIAHCVVIASHYSPVEQHLEVAVMVIHHLAPYYGCTYKEKYPQLDFNPNKLTNSIGRIQVYHKTAKNSPYSTCYIPSSYFLDTVNDFVSNICPKLPYCPTIVDYCWKQAPHVIRKPIEVIKKPIVPIPVKQSEEPICVICMDEPRTHAAIPCGHRHYCGTCIKKLTICAMCQQPIQYKCQIFL